MTPDLDAVIAIARAAGHAIMSIYAKDFSVEVKEDDSPLTLADKASNDLIVQRLQQLTPDIPIISEESRQLPYSVRKEWTVCWVVDPLDGTKEFIKRNGEFTVNIALVQDGRPVLGVVYIPVEQVTYAACPGKAIKIDRAGVVTPLQVVPPVAGETIVVMGSRSHSTPEVTAYVEQLKLAYGEVVFQSAGSSLKFCRIAEGKAHRYPRLGPTMEWDTAAGHAVVLEAGGKVTIAGTDKPLSYNKENLLNPFFEVSA